MKISRKILISLSKNNGWIGDFCATLLLDRAADAIEMNNVALAVDILQPLSANGNATAQFGLGSLYADGILIPQELEKGLLLLTQSAEQKNVKAQLALVELYEKLEATKPDYKKNIDHWCNVLASEGHEDALIWKASQLGASISLDMPYDNDEWKVESKLEGEIIGLLLKSALQGNAYAQYRMGRIYSITLQDKIEAYAWFSFSANQGNMEAEIAKSEILSDLNKDQYLKAVRKIRDLVRSQLNFVSECRKGEHGLAVTVKNDSAFFCERMKKLAVMEEIGWNKEESHYFVGLVDALGK